MWSGVKPNVPVVIAAEQPQLGRRTFRIRERHTTNTMLVVPDYDCSLIAKCKILQNPIGILYGPYSVIRAGASHERAP